jgi:hypothetical protein
MTYEPTTMLNMALREAMDEDERPHGYRRILLTIWSPEQRVYAGRASMRDMDWCADHHIRGVHWASREDMTRIIRSIRFGPDVMTLQRGLPYRTVAVDDLMMTYEKDMIVLS